MLDGYCSLGKHECRLPPGSPNPNLHKKLFQAETFIENATNGFNRTLDGSRVLNQ